MRKMTRKRRKRLLSNKLLVDVWGSHDTGEWNPEEVFKKLEKKEPIN
jgi:hypothetical protein